MTSLYDQEAVPFDAVERTLAHSGERQNAMIAYRRRTGATWTTARRALRLWEANAVEADLDPMMLLIRIKELESRVSFLEG